MWDNVRKHKKVHGKLELYLHYPSILLRVSTYIRVGAPVGPRAAEGDELVTSSVEDEAADCGHQDKLYERS